MRSETGAKCCGRRCGGMHGSTVGLRVRASSFCPLTRPPRAWLLTTAPSGLRQPRTPNVRHTLKFIRPSSRRYRLVLYLTFLTLFTPLCYHRFFMQTASAQLISEIARAIPKARRSVLRRWRVGESAYQPFGGGHSAVGGCFDVISSSACFQTICPLCGMV